MLKIVKARYTLKRAVYALSVEVDRANGIRLLAARAKAVIEPENIKHTQAESYVEI